MKALLSPQFLAQLKKLDVRIRNSFFEKILIFEKNKEDQALNNHALKREYQGYRSIDITADYRALYKELKEGGDTTAYFSLIGTHKELYG